MQYTDRATAPLKFHKFLTWFALPLGTLISVANLILWFSDGNAGRYFFDTCYYFLYALFTILCLVGMWSWKVSGPQMLFARQALDLIERSARVFADLFYNGDIVDSFADLAGVVIATAIFWVYYQKRMLLFGDREEKHSHSSIHDLIKRTAHSTLEATSIALRIFLVLLRFALPLFPVLWFSEVFALDGLLLFAFLFFWYAAPILCLPFWLYAPFYAASHVVQIPFLISAAAFIIGLLCIINIPIFLLPSTIPLLIVRYLGSRSIKTYNTDLWAIPASIPSGNVAADIELIHKRIQELEEQVLPLDTSIQAANPPLPRSSATYCDSNEYHAVISLLKDLPRYMDPYQTSHIYNRPVSSENMAEATGHFAKLRQSLLQMGKLYRAFRYSQTMPYSWFVNCEYVDSAIEQQREIFQRTASRLQYCYRP